MKIGSELLSGPRAETHGDFDEMVEKVEGFYTLLTGQSVDAKAFFVALKLGRIAAGSFHEDHFVDAACYLALWCASEEKKLDSEAGVGY